MKNKFKLIILSLITILTCIALTACKEGGAYGPEYDFTNFVDNYYLDEGVVIDGKFDEDFWKTEKVTYRDVASDGSKGDEEGYRNTKPFEETNVIVNTHFTDKGVYLATSVDDKYMVTYNEATNQLYTVYRRTGMGFYLCKPGVTSVENNALEIQVATDGSFSAKLFRNGAYNRYPLERIRYGVNVKNARLNERKNGTIDGYDIELFVPWEHLGLEKKPDFMYMAFAIVRHPDANGQTGRGFEKLVE